MTVAGQNSLDLQKIKISPLTEKDSIRHFSCGVRELDDWAKSKAFKWNDQDRSRVFITHLEGNSKALGWYCLTFSTEDTSKIADAVSRSRYPQGFPIMYLHYLAVTRSSQSSGLGTFLLMDAIKRAYIVSQHVAFYGVGLRSLNDRTTKLYQKYGFGIAPDEDTNPLMILPIWSIRDLMKQIGT